MSSISSDDVLDDAAVAPGAPPDADSEPGQSLYTYWAGLTALTLVSVGFGAIAPSFSDILDEFGASAGLGALIVSALGAGRLLGGFPAGIAVGRFGPGRVILLGTVVFIVGSAIGALAPLFPVLAVGRLVQGIGLGIVPAGVLAGMMTGARAERAGGSMALYQSALTLGGAFGPAIGGPVAAAFGWRYALVFCILAGVVSFLLAIPTVRRQPTPTPRSAAARESFALSALLAITLVLLPHLVTFMYRMSVGQLALPLYASGPAGLDPVMVGLLLGSQSVMQLLMLAPAGWATNRFGVRPVVAAALIVSSLGVAMMPFVPLPYGLWVAVIVFGAGLAVLGVASGLFVFTIGGFSTGALVSIYRLSGDLTQVFGPVVVGPILDHFGYTVSFVGMAACGGLALVTVLLRARKPRPEVAAAR
ncbi:MAG: MFS transporter [Chloroflexi bacterium]|nr:MFS transporter [Chloroflexota bacterium]